MVGSDQKARAALKAHLPRCVSEYTSQFLNVPQLDFSELMHILGYNKTYISKLLKRVREKNLTPIIVGSGGSMMNFMHWASEACKWTSVASIFNKVVVYEDDELDFTNLLRIPFIPKISQQNMYNGNILKIDGIAGRFEILSSGNIAQGSYFSYYNQRLTEQNVNDIVDARASNKIFIGAPDMETRKMLSEHEDAVFIAYTQQDASFSIVINPTIDNDMIMENYGKIELNQFFMNQIVQAMRFLEYLADEYSYYEALEKVNETIIHHSVDLYSLKLNGRKLSVEGLAITLNGLEDEGEEQ
jgi:hypothetical protein